MSKNRFYLFSIIILIAINITTLYFFTKKEPVKPRDIVIERLAFDDNQIAQYDKLIIAHQKKIRSLDDSIRITKNELYHLLALKDLNLSAKDSLLTKIARLQSEVETTHFNHFVDIKKLCKKEQLNNFNTLSNELSKLFAPKGMPKKER